MSSSGSPLPEQTSSSGRSIMSAVSDVCGRWTRDGLTVDPAPWNPGLKYGARRRKSYEGQGARNSILAGARPRDRIRWRRPVRSLAKAACGRGGPYVFKYHCGSPWRLSPTAPIETFAASTGERHPTDLAGLRGARLVTATETEEGRRLAEARVKALTGGDRISARFMRQD